jgi:hypothetical protein
MPDDFFFQEIPLSRTKSRSNARTSNALRWIGVAGACAVVGILALLISGRSRPPAEQGERRAIGAYRPGGGHRPYASGPPRAGAAERTEGALSPELEERLRAAAHVATVPATTSSGAPPPLPPTGPLPPEVQARRDQALTGWQLQAQQLLDGCVARPAAERRPVPLDVIFAPAAAANGLTVQQLSPMAVSVPPHELRRLWRDTDPDELQRCLDRVRTLALSVPAASKTSAQVLPAAMETVLVQL